jgi:hypothetical protein
VKGGGNCAAEQRGFPWPDMVDAYLFLKGIMSVRCDFIANFQFSPMLRYIFCWIITCIYIQVHAKIVITRADHARSRSTIDAIRRLTPMFFFRYG